MYSTIVVIAVLTSLSAPPLLRFCINRDRRQREDEEPTGVERPGEGEEVVAG